MSQSLDEMASELNKTQRKVAANMNSVTARVLPFDGDSGARFAQTRKTVSIALSLLTFFRQVQKVRKRRRK